MNIRRTFLLIIVASFLLCLPEAAAAMTRISVLLSRSSTPYNQALAGLRDLLYETGEQFDIRVHNIDGSLDEGHRAMMSIREERPALILSIGSAATEVAHEESGAYPVVFCMVSTPRESGFISSMISSKNNLTGVTLDVGADVQLDLMREVIPGIRRVGVVYNPSETSVTVKEAAIEASSVNMELVRAEIVSAQKLPDALSRLKGRVQAIWSVPDGTVFNPRSTLYIINYCLKNRIPLAGLSPYFVEEGALMSVSADYYEVGRQAGEIARKVLDGAKPASIPIERPRNIIRAINLRTAWNLGLSPSRELLSKFEKVIK